MMSISETVGNMLNVSSNIDFNESCVFVGTGFFCTAFLEACTLRIEF